MRFNLLHFLEKLFAVLFFFLAVGLLGFVLIRPELIFESNFNTHKLDIKIPEIEVEVEPLNIETPSTDKESLIKNVEESMEERYDAYFNSNTSKTEGDKLTTSGVVEFTNMERISRGLKPLENNETLNLVAYQRAKEMFDKEYFAHESPTGKTAEVLVATSNYDYLLVGENLAKGIFDNDEDLVSGWMDSPEHKENILKNGYEEIGVATEKGLYKETEIWIAVQIFATPTSSCPRINEELFNKINENQKQLSNLAEEINNLNSDISNIESRQEYNQKINEYNKLIKEYNSLQEELEKQIESYNKQIKERNDCLEKYKG